jgi:predicted 3-demethylubiquinone-9 3-methyltransferase (glyoxalase superfamily)
MQVFTSIYQIIQEEAFLFIRKFSLSEIDVFKFIAMDGSGNHQFDFSEGISFVVSTENQTETDYFWEKLTANGGKESRYGRLKDPFGVSWQIGPKRVMGS